MAYKLQLKRGASGSLPTGSAGEPLFTTDTNDLYIGTGSANQRYQKYIASGTSSQFLKGDGSLDSSTYQPSLNGTGFVKISGTTISYDNSTYALDSDVVKLAGTQTITGAKTFDTTTSTFVLMNSTNANGGVLTFRRSGTNVGHIGNSAQLGAGVLDAIEIRSGVGSSVILKTDAGQLTLATGGAATFNSSVTASSLIKSGGTSSQYLMADGSTSTLTNPVTGTGTTNYIPKWTSGTAIGNSAIYETSGNILINSTSDNGSRLQVTGNVYLGGDVGIGNSSPSGALHVSTFGKYSYFSSNADGAYPANVQGISFGWNLSGGSGETIIAYNKGGGSTGGLVFANNDGGSYNSRMVLTSSGNLGLGTSSPANKLDVVGNINVPSAYFFRYDGDTGLIGSGSSINGGSVSQLGIRAASDILFATNGANLRMTLNSSGNLGLGVVPSAWLSSFKVLQVGTASVSQIANRAYLTANWFYDTQDKYIASDYATMYRQQNGQHEWLTAPSGTAGNAISFTQAMTLNASGNLGLGTTGPVLRLDVQGNVLDTATISSVTVEQVSLFRPSNGVGGIRTGFNTSTGDAYMWSANSGSSINFGTRSAPNNTAHLSLASTGAATFSSSVTAGGLNLNSFVNAPSGLNLELGYDGTQGVVQAYNRTTPAWLPLYFAGSYITFNPAGTERLRITSGGSVGIGTTTPGSKLSIVGLPTSSAGLSAGDIWNDGGTLKIV